MTASRQRTLAVLAALLLFAALMACRFVPRRQPEMDERQARIRALNAAARYLERP